MSYVLHALVANPGSLPAGRALAWESNWIGLIPLVGATFIFAAGFGVQFVGVGILWTTAVQKHVPRELMGRVLSIDAFGGTLLLPFAPVVFAAIVAAFGPSPAFVIGGVISLVVAALLLLVPAIRELE